LKNELFVNVIYTLQGSMMTLISWFSWQLVHCLSIVSVSLSLPVCLLGGVWHLRSSQSVDLRQRKRYSSSKWSAEKAYPEKFMRHNITAPFLLDIFFVLRGGLVTPSPSLRDKKLYYKECHISGYTASQREGLKLLSW